MWPPDNCGQGMSARRSWLPCEQLRWRLQLRVTVNEVVPADCMRCERHGCVVCITHDRAVNCCAPSCTAGPAWSDCTEALLLTPPANEPVARPAVPVTACAGALPPAAAEAAVPLPWPCGNPAGHGPPPVEERTCLRCSGGVALPLRLLEGPQGASGV
mmetsp:Transcript_105940/g.326979  ORF Transcript_105940/g.326979 Transcript_105940/m.326979 type:complete len:158 (-) Transcript_105940:474-947(-)